MTQRVLVAGLLAGIALFVWASISHMALGLGGVGIRQISNEAPVLSAMRDNIREPGFYFFPGRDESPGMSSEQKKAAMSQWEQKYRTGPRGILIYHPTGEQPLSTRQLVTELASNIAACLLAAWLMARAAPNLPGFLVRALAVVLFGLIGALNIHVSYWNWYGFPSNYSAAAMVDETIGWFVAGLVLAWRLKPSEK